jgi:hypothetical protein
MAPQSRQNATTAMFHAPEEKSDSNNEFNDLTGNLMVLLS